jgi:hypothetical protein
MQRASQCTLAIVTCVGRHRAVLPKQHANANANAAPAAVSLDHYPLRHPSPRTAKRSLVSTNAQQRQNNSNSLINPREKAAIRGDHRGARY